MNHPAIAFLVEEQYEAGVLFCESAIAANPKQAEHYWYLGLIRLLQGDEAEAQAAWFSALTMIELDTLDLETQKLLAILQHEAERQLNLGRSHLAERIYQQVIEMDASQPFIYLQLGQAACLQGKLDEAIDDWQTATQLQPDLVEAYVHQAEVLQRLEQWDAAIVVYQQALNLKSSASLHYNLGICFGHQQQWQAALEQFNQALNLEPDFAAAWGDRGWAQLQLTQWERATQDFAAALRTYSTYAQTYHDWVEQLQQRSLPCPDVLRRNTIELNQLCTAAEQDWQQWTTTLQPASSHASTTSTDSLSPPSNYWLDTQSWAAKDSEVEFIALDEPNTLVLHPPKTIDHAIHFSFRLPHEISVPCTFVVRLPNARFWLSADQSSNAIITQSNELLGDLSPEFPLLSPGHPDKHPSQHSIFRRSLPPIQQIDGTVAVLAGLTNDLYFHWMFDVLPRFDLLTRSNIDIESIDYFLISSHLPFQKESLLKLGISLTKILETQDCLHIQANHLIVPSYPSSPAWMTKRVCDWLRSVFLTSNSIVKEGCDRIYITRQHTTSRRIINESELIDLLQPLGFQIVALETLSVQAQAQLLASASVVISAHGAGLTNLTFCQPGTKVIEIFSPNFVYPCYWLVSNLLQLDYYYTTGTIPEGCFLHSQLYPNPRAEDIFLDLTAFKQILQLANIR